MSAIDSLITIAIVFTFFFFIGSKIYNHEKEHLDPIINKIKGWFNKEDDGDETLGPNDDFDISFRGQIVQ